MAYLVVADVADHTVRRPVGFNGRREAEAYLVSLGMAAVDDGYETSFEETGGVLHVHGHGGTETYRIIESSDEEVLRMSHVAPPSEYRPPRLP